ncbi:hypothetical protein D3C87_2188520 [compost metagenome]
MKLVDWRTLGGSRLVVAAVAGDGGELDSQVVTTFEREIESWCSIESTRTPIGHFFPQ